jgi:purine-binding chemotaxis protein CheW
MDLARRFGHGPAPYRTDQAIVVLNWEDEMLAVIVDEVYSVTTIRTSQIEPVPRHAAVLNAQSPFLAALAKVDDNVVMLLNLVNLLYWAGDTTAAQLPGADTAPGAAALLDTVRERYFAPEAAPQERAVFKQRALALAISSEAGSTGELAPVALVALNGELFGIDLNNVTEFCDLRHVSPVPCCPDHIVGQMNLRGDVVTLVDIQPLLNMPPRGAVAARKVVVAEHEEAPVGILLDDVIDLLYLRPEDLTPPPASQAGKFYSQGAFHDGRMICVLDIAQILRDGSLVVNDSM